MVLLDNVQFARGFTWVNRNRLKFPEGELWFTVPVKKKGRGRQKINEVEIFHERGWARKFFQSLSQNYAHAPFFNDHIEFLKDLFQEKKEKLVDLNFEALKYLTSRFGIKDKFVFQSALKIKDARGPQLLVEVCKKLGAEICLTSLASKKYLDANFFARNGIAVKFFKFTPPVYPQLWGDFIYNLSALDLLLNCGDKSLEIIRKYNHESGAKEN